MKNYIQLEIPFEIEEWRDIEGYEGLYQVSDLGRVRSLPRNTTKGGIIKLLIRPNGYLYVDLYKNGKNKKHNVHRLVAEAFLPNPNNLPCINHKSEIRTENYVDNLEWCTYQYNSNYGNCKRKIILSRNASGKKSAEKQVKQMSIDGRIICIWKSTAEAERHGYSSSHISKCCNGKRKTHRGCLWAFC